MEKFTFFQFLVCKSVKDFPKIFDFTFEMLFPLIFIVTVRTSMLLMFNAEFDEDSVLSAQI